MAEKLSKKELKSPDAFQTTFERMGDYVLENKSRVMVVSAALVCAFVLAMVFTFTGIPTRIPL